MADKKLAKHAGGRPTSYSAEMLQKAKDYITEYKKHEHAVPSVAGLATILKVNRSTIYEWAADAEKSEFSNIYNQILAEQEQITLSNGLNGDFNATIAKLLLGKHGYSDKAETQTTVTLDSMSDDELSARIQALLPR